MKIDRVLVDHLADLSRLSFTDGEKTSLELELTEILGLMEQLGAIDISGVNETASVLPIRNVFREDVPAPSAPTVEILSNAPEPLDGSFAVPRVVG